MTQTQTAQTIHGDVEYETVDCDSCGMEVRKNTASRFIVLDEYDYRDSHYSVRYKFKRHNAVRGWACRDCKDNDITAFPQNRNKEKVKEGAKIAVISVISFLFGVSLCLVFLF